MASSEHEHVAGDVISIEAEVNNLHVLSDASSSRRACNVEFDKSADRGQLRTRIDMALAFAEAHGFYDAMLLGIMVRGSKVPRVIYSRLSFLPFDPSAHAIPVILANDVTKFAKHSEGKGVHTDAMQYESLPYFRLSLVSNP